MYEVSLSVYTERHAAVRFTATLLQARALDAAPQCGAPQRDEEAQIYRRVVGDRRCSKHFTSLRIPVALEAFIASKELLVRRPAPPGIRPFLENKRPIQVFFFPRALFIPRMF